MTNDTDTTKPRGFAKLPPERRREIASNGGKKAHAVGRARRYTSEEAKEAGRKGGLAVSQDREHMRRIGAIGGRTRRRKESARAAWLLLPVIAVAFAVVAVVCGFSV